MGSSATLRIWDARTGKELSVLAGHQGRVISVQFSPDSRLVVTSSDDKTSRIWDSRTAKELTVLKGHLGRINSAQFSPDGRLVVTASEDKTARIWAVARVFVFPRVRHQRLQTLVEPLPPRGAFLGRQAPLPGADGIGRLVKRLRRHAAELFTFLDRPEVPFDNNHAERMIRPAVIIRKNSYANGSFDGADLQAVLMSIYRTLKQRGHNPIQTIIAAVRTYFKTRSLPPLPAKSTELG